MSTVNNILLVDLETRQINIVESGRREYYGISWWENNDQLVLSHSGVENDRMLDLESYIHSEKGYLSYNNKQSACFLSQPHQILCAPDNIIIATNTGRNCISFYNAENGYYKDLRINDIYWDRLGPDNACGEHFNSIFLKRNRLYVLAHRFKRGSQVLVFSYPEGELIDKYEANHRNGMHNIWVDNEDNLFACHSEAGELVDIKADETVWASGASHYSRGLAVSSDYILIGDSEIVARVHRKNLLSELWVIDRHSLKTLDYIPLGNYGAVHEVRLLDAVDEAHNSSLFSGLDLLEAQIKSNEEQKEMQRQKKLSDSQHWQANRHLLNQFNCVLNGWQVVDGGWIKPKNAGMTVGFFKNASKGAYNVSFEYSFDQEADGSHLSFIFNYCGPDDSNMSALLLLYNKSLKQASLGYWVNTNDAWQNTELLLADLPITGQLSIKISEEQFTVSAKDLPAVSKATGWTQGHIGFRAYGSQFKNVALTLGEGSGKSELRKKVKTIYEKLGIS
ncbi:hypothetical protein [Legionella birminghamensis]|uniref:hypothetical protein n=1 Tax=Legionella birminghamensis TaxID=28083 RepID=UPI001ED9BD6E|nr:hypothetical protein [Legionella birminghamensis]